MPVWLMVLGVISGVALGWAGFYFTFYRADRRTHNEFFRLALASDGSNGLPPHKDIFTILADVAAQGAGLAGLQSDVTEVRRDLADATTILADGQRQLSVRMDSLDIQLVEAHRRIRSHQQNEIALRAALSAALENGKGGK